MFISIRKRRERSEGEVCVEKKLLWLFDNVYSCLCFRYVLCPGQMRPEVCSGWWRRRFCSREGQRKHSCSDSSVTTALQRERAQVTHIYMHILTHLHSALDQFMHCFSAGHTVVLKSANTHHFLLGHSHGTDWVEYDTHGWLNLAKLNPTPQNAANLLQNSQK